MKTIARIMFNGNHYPGGAAPALQAAGYGVDDASIVNIRSLGSVAVTMDVEESDPRRGALLAVLKGHNVSWQEIVFDRYTADELISTPLIVVMPNSENEVDGGPEAGTAYDVASGCVRCGTGAIQTSPLILRGDEVDGLRHVIAAQTYHRDVLVRETVANAMEAEGVTGLDTRLVFESLGHTQRRMPFRQIRAVRSLPPMSQSTTGLIRENVCPVCRRNGFFQTGAAPTRPAYRAGDIRDAQDVNATWECFGYSILEPDLRDSVIAQPLLVISPKVLKIFMDHGITAFDYYPIRIDADP